MFGWFRKKSPEALSQIAWEKAHDEVFKAGRKGNFTKVVEIFDRYPDATAWKDDGKSVLYLLMERAIKDDNLQLITEVIAKYPQAKEITNEKNATPLHIALVEGQMKSFLHLIDKGCNTETRAEYVYWASIDARDNMNLFNAACLLNKKDFALHLLKLGKDPTLTNYKVEEKVNKNQKLKYYIERAPQIRAEYLAAEKLEQKAAQQQQVEAKIETKEKINLEVKKIFFDAIQKGDVATIASTVAIHPDALQWRSASDLPVLFFAMKANRLDSFRHLANLGADIDGRLNSLSNPPRIIHMAAENKQKEFVRFLVQQGARTNESCGWDGDDFRPEFRGSVATAYEIAAQKGYFKIADILQNAPKIREEYLATTNDVLPAGKNGEPNLQQQFNQMSEKLKKTETALAQTNKKLDEALKRIEALESPAQAAILKQAMPGREH